MNTKYLVIGLAVLGVALVAPAFGADPGTSMLAAAGMCGAGILMDKGMEFSDAQAVTASAISTNVMDLGVSHDFGVAADLFLVVQCDVTATDAGSDATLTISLESDSTADLATSATVHHTSAAIALASLVAGETLLVVPVPPGAYERYLGVRYTVASGPLTAGKFSAFLSADVQRWKAYTAVAAS